MGLGSGIRDPGYGKNPESRGHKGTGSRIPDPDPQHWIGQNNLKSKMHATETERRGVKTTKFELNRRTTQRLFISFMQYSLYHSVQ